jgi:hypothetical protein
LCRGTDLGKGNKIFLQYWRSKNTVVIILKRNTFGTTKTLPRADRQAQLNNRGRRALVREVTKNPMVTDRAPEFLCGDGRTFQKANYL